ncbi:MAG: amidohydrolase family protein [Desulfurococcaceae archaeon]
MDYVDTILLVKILLTLDEPVNYILDGAIAIKNGIIVDYGPRESVLNKYRSENIIEKPHHIAMPGLIDCHTHTQQYLLRSLINDKLIQLPPVWTKLLVPFEQNLDSELARLSTQASLINMVRNGIVYYVEAGAPYPEIVVEETIKIGVKGAVSYATYDICDDEVRNSSEVIDRVEKLLIRYHSFNNNVKIWTSLRQIMMSSEELVHRVIEIAEKWKTGLTIHLGEYQGEVDYTLSKYGLRPLEYLLKIGLNRVSPIIVSHGLLLSPHEIRLIRENDISICWCPTVDAWLTGIHWAGLMNNGVKVAIGSDGGVWNRLDLLHEAKIAKAIGKSLGNSILYYKSGLSSEDLIKMITGLGGNIVKDKVGSIKHGYSADIIILEYNDLRTLPLHNPISLVIDFLEGYSVTDVFVNGRHIVENGIVKSIDEEKVINRILDREDDLRRIVNEVSKNLPIK